jgi:hypothetical protein
MEGEALEEILHPAETLLLQALMLSLVYRVCGMISLWKISELHLRENSILPRGQQHPLAPVRTMHEVFQVTRLERASRVILPHGQEKKMMFHCGFKLLAWFLEVTPYMYRMSVRSGETNQSGKTTSTTISKIERLERILEEERQKVRPP